MNSKIKILAFLLLVSIVSRAQDSLYFTNNVYNLPSVDTLNFSISDTIVNLGSSPFSGTITFAARVDSTPLTSSQFTFDSIYPSDTLAVFPASGYRKAFAINISNDTAPPFIIGPNTIVIWPIIQNPGLVPINPSDTIYIYTTITTGITESPLSRMYIFETPGQLNINFGDAQNLVQQVRIYDVLGQSMYAAPPDRSKNIHTAGWSMGIYLCEITTISGEKRTFKFRLH